MIDHRVITRYASALLKVAMERDNVLKVRRDMDSFLELIKGRADLLLLLTDHLAPKGRRIDLLKEIIDEEKMCDEVFKFFALLIHSSRIDYMERIASVFNQLVDDRLGIIRGEVVVANKRQGSGVVDRLGPLLEKKLAKKINMSFKEDTSIIGGLILRMGNRVYDASIKRMFYEMKERICQ